MVADTGSARSMNGEPTLARINLSACEYRGRVLEESETDLWVEDRFFPGWRNLLINTLPHQPKDASYPSFILIADQDQPTLEYSGYKPFLLLAGDEAWRDVTVSCVCRVLEAGTFPQTIDETTFDFQGRVGAALRVQDARRHYFAGFQNTDRFVIAAREDANWVVLNHQPFAVDPHRYYALEARCQGGRIELFVDGEMRLSASDARWANGPSGLYGNTMCRWRDLSVRCAPAEVEAISARRSAAHRVLAAAQSQVPQANLQREIPLRGAENAKLQGSMAIPGDTDRLLLEYTEGDRIGLWCVDLEGKVRWRRLLWNRGFFVPGRPHRPYAVQDINLDGKPEVVVANHSELLVLRAIDGEIQAQAPVPDDATFLCLRHKKPVLNRNIHICQVHGANRPASIALFQDSSCGGHTIWCYDHTLQTHWTHHNAAGRFGHDLAHFDVNGDGRDEIVASYYALDGDGNVVWRIQDQDLRNWHAHADLVVAGRFDADPQASPRVVVTAGNHGVLFLDGDDGKVLNHYRGIGHCQRLVAGNFCHDRPGTEIWIVNDWGSCGIHYIFDARGELLLRKQLDPRGICMMPVRWWPERDLLFMQETPETLGLWNSAGQRVVDLYASSAVPQSLKPTRTGLPHRMPFVPVRLSGAQTECLAAVDGEELLLFGPER